MIPRTPVSTSVALASASCISLLALQTHEIVLASTTSTQDSGLLDHVLSTFHQARAVTDWITSAAAPRLVGEFGSERFGKPLFVPSARTG